MNIETNSARRTRRRLVALACLACVVLGPRGTAREPGPAPGVLDPDTGGIRVNRRDVLFGNPRKTERPAVVDLNQCTAATPEGKKIDEDGITPGTAKYNILMAKAHARVRKAVKQAAVGAGRDCVVKAGSIQKNPDDLEVADLTGDVIAALAG